ncbi:hypothetical protein SOVF_170920 [Spinacia oleracea]|uniref:UDP-glycosyltransferase 74E2-like n=1 Tax=Spinacia oleracea TaxID=3562 RepID=A0ABM3R9V5_SPIOL|nr:UDP-glycosyltransferase 74E2-like [Spinacia oleracea]KNA07535.1 hypothetical protein SOVF_170920 [Spinacia oleracea]
MLVYDAYFPWALDVAKDHNILAAAYFVSSCAYVASFYPMFLEEFGSDDQHPVVAAESVPGLLVELPSREEMERYAPKCAQSSSSDDKPDTGKKPLHPVYQMVVSSITTLHLADFVLFNSFDHLEHQVVKWMTNLWRVKTVGPLLPSAYLDKRIESDVNYCVKPYKPNNEACMSWLNAKQVASVVYVSFGSVAKLSVEQISEIAKALKQIPSSFLWIVREAEQEKLPNDFITETSEKGLVMSWCPQLDVLAHEAVGCFITHCGWNSVIEATSFGVPMLGMPQFMDHFLDAHFLEKVWGVGIRVKADEKNFVTCDEIKRGLEKIIYGERGNKIKENATKWKELAKEAVGEGGSSDNSTGEIIKWLASS